MRDLTRGPVAGHILRMAAALLASKLLNTAYALVDLFWIGRLGTEAVAAVSFASNLMMVWLVASQALLVGTTVLIAQATGRKDQAGAQDIFNRAGDLGLAGGLAFAALAYALRDAYCAAFAADARTARLGAEFLNWYIASLAVQFPGIAMGASLRGIGRMMPGVWIQVGTVLLNMALAPVLIFGWGYGHPLGVAGASLATFLSALAGTTATALYMGRPQGHLRWQRWPVPRPAPVWRSIARIGLPTGGEYLFATAYLFVVYALLKPFGAEAQAGFGIGQRILQAALLGGVSVGVAVASVAGQNVGAGRADRVRECFRSASLMLTVYMLALTLLFQLVPGPLVALFSGDGATVGRGGEFLGIAAWNLVASGLVMVCGGMFQGIGNTWPSLLASGTRIGLVVGTALWMAGRAGFELRQLWWLSVAAVWLQMVLCLWLLGVELARRLPSREMSATLADSSDERAG